MKVRCKLILWLVIGSLALPIQAQKYKAKVTLDHPDSWTMVFLPDIQNYSKFKQNQPILDLMNRWIEANVEALNIRMVLCAGDLVEQDDVILPGADGNISSKEQWTFVRNTFSVLDHKVPYILAAGNHDYTIDREGSRSSHYDSYLTIDQNYLNQKHLVQYGFDEAEKPTLTNAMYEFRNLNGLDYLVVNLEYAPRDQTLDWAKEILNFDQYANHRIVLLTHAYLHRNDQRLDGENRWIVFEPYFKDSKVRKSDRILLPSSNNGEQIWQKLVHNVPGMQLVLSGHISGEGYRKDRNQIGKEVHQMLFDMQSEGGGHLGNGGDGFLRVLEFYPDNKTVKVKTFSPLFALSPKTAHLAFKKDDRNEFAFTMEVD